MTEGLGDISELKIAMNTLYPFVAAYYKIKSVVERMESKSSV